MRVLTFGRFRAIGGRRGRTRRRGNGGTRRVGETMEGREKGNLGLGFEGSGGGE